jgi:hypothetical protein
MMIRGSHLSFRAIIPFPNGFEKRNDSLPEQLKRKQSGGNKPNENLYKITSRSSIKISVSVDRNQENNKNTKTAKIFIHYIYQNRFNFLKVTIFS